MESTIELHNGDCLEVMKSIPDGSIDAIITDPPYGIMKNASLDGWNNQTTAWDTALPIKDIFDNAERVLRMNWCLVLFSQEPYTSQLITQAHWNLPFSYRMIWKKDHFANALLAKKAPVSYFEDIIVFFKAYDTNGLHPLREYVIRIIKHIWKTKKQIFEEMGHQWICHFWRYDSLQFDLCTEKTYNELIEKYDINKVEWFLSFEKLIEINRRFNRGFNLPEWQKFKSNILEYKKDYDGFHPTQKPVKLLEDLIFTYSNEWETVLDFTMGSGTTWVACKNLNRNFIGIEMDENYFNIARNRLK